MGLKGEDMFVLLCLGVVCLFAVIMMLRHDEGIVERLRRWDDGPVLPKGRVRLDLSLSGCWDQPPSALSCPTDRNRRGSQAVALTTMRGGMLTRAEEEVQAT